jgi:hypothetical protein
MKRRKTNFKVNRNKLYPFHSSAINAYPTNEKKFKKLENAKSQQMIKFVMVRQMCAILELHEDDTGKTCSVS